MLLASAKGALRRKTVKQIVPIPFRGLNTKDQLNQIDPEYALQLDNFELEQGRLKVRRGYIEHVTGIVGSIETLIPYKTAITEKLFAAANNAIYDVSSAGVVGAAEVSILTNNRWDFTQFSTLGVDYLMLCNAADGVRSYDGTTWATESITGPTAGELSKFKGVIHHKARLWYIEDGTFNLWYMDTVLAKSGGATKFPVGGLFAFGGEIAAIASWTRDGGSGMDDYFIVISSGGEVLIYQGTDPSSTTWSIVGRYVIPRPIGETRCAVNVSDDLWILTEIGIVSLKAVTSGEAILDAISYPIGNSFQNYVNFSGTSFGWEIKLFLASSYVIVNVPTVQTENLMLVYSIRNSAWMQWKDLPSICLIERNREIYFGGQDGVVYKFSGFTDNGSAIQAEVIFGWNDFEIPEFKSFKSARLHFRSSALPRPEIYMQVDYNTSVPLSTPFISDETEGSLWDVSIWNEASWSSPSEGKTARLDLVSEGFVGAFNIVVRKLNVEMELAGVEINFVVGNVS